METYNENNKFFDPIKSVNSGQVFLWQKYNDSWYGIDGQNVLKFTLKKQSSDGNRNNNIEKKETDIEFQSYPWKENWEKNFFRLDDNYHSLKHTLSRDNTIKEIYIKYEGLRVIRQNSFQCTITFLCASNTNIKRIRRMLNNLSKKFGKKIFYDGLEFYLFPQIKELSNASINELISCGLGYRAKFVKSVAKDIETKTINFEDIRKKSYELSKSELLKLNGIGNKTADCILLFSFDKLSAFPIDVWIYRSLLENYSWFFDTDLNLFPIGKLTKNQYNNISSRIRNYFGEYSGYVQQYLYYHIRETAKKTW